MLVKKVLRYLSGLLVWWMPWLPAQAQDLRGDEGLHAQRYVTDSLYRLQHDRLEQHLYRAARQASPGTRDLLTIPVVVHVVHRPGDTISGARSSYRTQQQVRAGLARLNEAFRRQGAYASGPQHSTALSVPGVEAVDTEIEFCLADRDADGLPQSGIRYVASQWSNVNFADLLVGQTLTQDQALKAESYWDANQYLNVWLVNRVCEREGQNCDLHGYAYLPGAHGTPLDGVVVEAAYWGDDPDSMAVPVYYVGRYLNLWATSYRNINTTPCANDDCLLQGDRVCDTPPDAQRGGPACGDTVNTCHSDSADTDSSRNPFVGRDVSDLYENFMDLGPQLSCANHFTAGQKRRMRETLRTVRQSLLSSQGCASLRPSARLDSLRATTDCQAQVWLANTGPDTLRQVSLQYRWGNQTDSLTWQGSLPPAAGRWLTLPLGAVAGGSSLSLTATLHTLDGQAATGSISGAFTCPAAPLPEACEVPTRIPQQRGAYRASRVCVDAAGWTHFIKAADAPPATAQALLIASLRSPSRVEQGWNPRRVAAVLTHGYGQGGHDLSGAGYAEHVQGWYSTGRYLLGDSALQAPELEVRMYYDTQDLADLDQALAPQRLPSPAALTPWLLPADEAAAPHSGQRQMNVRDLRWFEGLGRGGAPAFVPWRQDSLRGVVLTVGQLGTLGLGSGGLGLGYGPRYPQPLPAPLGEVRPDGHHLRWTRAREWDLIDYEILSAWGQEPLRSLGRVPARNLGLAADSLASYAWSVDGNTLGPGRYAYVIAAHHGSGYVQYSDTLWLDWQTQEGVTVYPNPTRGPLRIALDLPPGQPIRLEILDATRRSLLQRTWTQGDPVPPLSLRHLPVGLYFYHLTSGQKQWQGRVLRVP